MLESFKSYLCERLSGTIIDILVGISKLNLSVGIQFWVQMRHCATERGGNMQNTAQYSTEEDCCNLVPMGVDCI